MALFFGGGFSQLKASMKGWEDKHEDLSKRIKLYQKSQKELEDTVTLKDHNVEVRPEHFVLHPLPLVLMIAFIFTSPYRVCAWE